MVLDLFIRFFHFNWRDWALSNASVSYLLPLATDLGSLSFFFLFIYVNLQPPILVFFS